MTSGQVGAWASQPMFPLMAWERQFLVQVTLARPGRRQAPLVRREPRVQVLGELQRGGHRRRWQLDWRLRFAA